VVSTAAEYRSDTLQGIDFDVPCGMVWARKGIPTVTCGPADAVADVDYICNTSEPASKFACADCVGKLERQGRLMGVRYF